MSIKSIAIIGAGMIASAHAAAYRQFSQRFPGTDFRLKTICDMNQTLAKDMACKYGFEQTADDWNTVIDDDDISVISVCLPNFLHTIVTQAALKAGKNVICEKPLALNADLARPIRDAAKNHNGVSGTVFNYRRIPAISDIHARIDAGQIGQPIQISVKFQCDYAADPKLPHSWRYQFDKAGPGALLDIGTHAVDTMRYLFGDINEVVGATANISIPERYLARADTTGHGHAELSTKTATVDNDDVMSALLRFDNGAQGYLSASRVAVGLGNCLSVEALGTNGTIRYSTETPSHFDLAIFDGKTPANFTRIPNRPGSPGIALAAVPHDYVSIGYTEIFGFMIHEFLSAIANGTSFDNGSLEDGYRAAQVLDAIQLASVEKKPVAIDWKD